MDVHVEIDPRLLRMAMRSTGVRDTSRLLNAGLRALIARSHSWKFALAARYQPLLIAKARRRDDLT